MCVMYKLLSVHYYIALQIANQAVLICLPDLVSLNHYPSTLCTIVAWLAANTPVSNCRGVLT
jgi:hypothetical protein